MSDMIGTPIDLVINLYTMAFNVGKGPEEEFIASDFARFIDIAFCLIDKETGDEFYTEPITYSMN
ncbi:MAG: hypothetical protein ACW99Q_14435 [Candidatus Kariarchaeaceae archaeon]|jgi:hypothetical protein